MEYLANSYFHYPASKSRDYVHLRQDTTNKYGNLTWVVLVTFLIGVTGVNTLVKRGFYIHSHVRILRWLYTKFSNRGGAAEMFRRVIFSFHYHLSTIVQLTFWLIILSSLSLSELYDGDLIFLTKRLGKIATNSLPTILFLTLRPSPLPNTLYLALIPVHKWLSRFIILQSVVHTIIYLGYFNTQNSWNKAWKVENLYGWLALFGFLIILVTSLSKFRNYFYKVFYFFHYLCTWVIVIALQYHVRPVKCTPFTIANLVIMVFQIVNRVLMTRRSQMGDLRITDVSPNLIYIEFPNKLITKPSLTPASHIRLAKYSDNAWRRIYQNLIPNYHPYTLVSLPNDFTQKLIIKKGKFKFTDQKYLITGGYDANLLFIHNNTDKFQISKLKVDTKRVLIVVGGSAISFALPILRVMNYHGVPVKIVWVVRDYRDIAVLKYFDGYVHGDDFEIFVTGSETVEEPNGTRSYGTCNTSLGAPRIIDPRRDETESLLDHTVTSRWEDENVDISMIEESEEEVQDDDCCKDSQKGSTIEGSDIFEDFNDVEVIEDDIMSDLSRTHSTRTTTSSGTNEHFIPRTRSINDINRGHLDRYRETIERLNISNKIYKGRPKLNYRYYNWCLHEGFTQCSGPVSLGGGMVCCRDLPRNNVSDADASKVWVLSAGPIGLVTNVKIWAKENGLKFHEEAFYT
ncbi:putative ferric reductase transmembrane component 8 [Yamadazyma tenuis]|uniref:Ferric oxidoreductase domain-containing protein n=1 Tax=Candida tenuis (strain ATCC 10573 / BCRC 21748 / CBS 615 / JCM 9827 / NBRC 10315 / NRRL Y-1498 / VKM Y-70) TaxID=590646 RepID=G3AWK2_CANTC|nr:uncharacterized protein CANTEDRAFT_100903 [Yamadazyma tenuis ATCC 10573]EGV66559.1 hypothetical protein CANTEDRAFT_100903 [Yamadazyma tenuis ATCC 10573]WEJ95320.1 putative ferric reductase transmembrane component 8 [Yamadazyma tenuis]